MLTVSLVPVRSDRMSLETRLAGDFVGNGPSVSEAVTVQVPEVEPDVEPDVEPVVSVEVSTGSTESLEQLITGMIAASPNAENPLFKNSLRSIMQQFCEFKYIIVFVSPFVAEQVECIGQRPDFAGESADMGQSGLPVLPFFDEIDIAVAYRQFSPRQKPNFLILNVFHL